MADWRRRNLLRHSIECDLALDSVTAFRWATKDALHCTVKSYGKSPPDSIRGHSTWHATHVVQVLLGP